MHRGAGWAIIAFVWAATAAYGQGMQDERPFQPEKKTGFEVDGLFRQEWTREFFDPSIEDESRQLGRLRPQINTGGDRFRIVVGGEFNYGSDENWEPPEGSTTRLIIRDNYKSRDARLDLAALHLQPVRWLQLDAGRIVMPFGLTEMIWDRDLRPQGGALRLSAGASSEIETLSVGALYAQGSHVFEDEDTRMYAFSGKARIKAGTDSHFELNASYITWERLDGLETMIRRQNSRDANNNVRDDYGVMDFVGRIQLSGGMPLQLVGDIAWNTKLDDNNHGLWLSVIMGSLNLSRARGEYTYAQVDRDLTVAAYNSDDFFWNTGWLGHRLELATRISDRATVHAIGQLQRFKDAPNLEERDHWVQRFRLELRVKN
jgi:hypothetical protein